MTLRAYVAALNDGVEEGCKGSGKECLLDSLRVGDIEVATTYKRLKTLKEGGNAPTCWSSQTLQFGSSENYYIKRIPRL